MSYISESFLTEARNRRNLQYVYVVKGIIYDKDKKNVCSIYDKKTKVWELPSVKYYEGEHPGDKLDEYLKSRFSIDVITKKKTDVKVINTMINNVSTKSKTHIYTINSYKGNIKESNTVQFKPLSEIVGK